jgi:ribosomal protein S18 acetylase RimI-like enzyme
MSSLEDLTILHAESGHHLEEVRVLFREYAASLGFDLDFQDFDGEMTNLPGDYTPPEGCILLARCASKTIGCVALHKLESRICEMKRLYVRPAFRGKGIGRVLSESVVAEARRLGYAAMRLDTLASMVGARGLYRSMGFKEIEPYRFNPLNGAVFMELAL